MKSDLKQRQLLTQRTVMLRALDQEGWNWRAADRRAQRRIQPLLLRLALILTALMTLLVIPVTWLTIHQEAPRVYAKTKGVLRVYDLENEYLRRPATPPTAPTRPSTP